MTAAPDTNATPQRRPRTVTLLTVGLLLVVWLVVSALAIAFAVTNGTGAVAIAAAFTLNLAADLLAMMLLYVLLRGAFNTDDAAARTLHAAQLALETQREEARRAVDEMLSALRDGLKESRATSEAHVSETVTQIVNNLERAQQRIEFDLMQNRVLQSEQLLVQLRDEEARLHSVGLSFNRKLDELEAAMRATQARLQAEREHLLKVARGEIPRAGAILPSDLPDLKPAPVSETPIRPPTKPLDDLPDAAEAFTPEPESEDQTVPEDDVYRTYPLSGPQAPAETPGLSDNVPLKPSPADAQADDGDAIPIDTKPIRFSYLQGKENIPDEPLSPEPDDDAADGDHVSVDPPDDPAATPPDTNP